MQVDQTNLWENVTRNVNQDNSSKAIAAYQANMPKENGIFGAQQEHFDRTVGISEKGSIDMATYPNPAKQEGKETVAEQFDKEGENSAANRRNEMAVIANTTSTEDLKKMEEDGFSLSETDSRTIITVTDKIKAVLAKAGVDISGYGDGLSKEQLEEITGNPAVTQQIMQTLEYHDLPATEANVTESVDALQQASSISGLNENAIGYMLKNDLEPTIQNLYMASHSVSAAEMESGSVEIDFSSLQPQMEQVITDAGLPVNEQNLENSKWLIENQIPLTEENLQYLSALQQLSTQIEKGTIDWNEVIDSMAHAISEGRRPADASMITARRKLEETRLAMTADASSRMKKAGVEIDLKPLEQQVEDLKAQEKQYYHNLLEGAGIEPTEKHVDMLADTLAVFEEMKGQPAYVLGQIASEDSIQTIHDTGRQLQAELARVSASYETLMTSPRKDMGDSIQKAFSNVDDILADMNLDTTEANRRAVRILAYNQTAITEENLTAVKALDEEMQRAFSNMNPAVTLEMIRRGDNPLDMNMAKLNQVAEEIRQETGDAETERFNKYLWKLEQNHEISEEERSSYIGIYRLIAQVEKTDGAAIGFLMKQGTELTMRNLLTAVRSGKKGAMDYTVSDDFEGIDSKSTGPKIDDQIAVGFQQNCLKDVLDAVTPEKLSRIGEDRWQSMTPEQLSEALLKMEESAQEQEAMKEYTKEQLFSYQQVMEAPEEIYSYLDRYDIANNMANVMAAADMLRRPNQMMERLFREDRFSQSSMEKLAALKQQVLEEFGEALENPEALADAQEVLADVAEHVMDTMIIENPTISTLDIRAMRQMTAQFRLCAQKAEEESYMVPVQTGDSVTGVSLKIVRGKEEKGMVDILFDGGEAGKIAASFQAKEQGISGMIAVSEEETGQLVADHLKELTAMMQETTDGEQEAVDIRMTYVSDLSLSRFEASGLEREAKMKENHTLSEDRSNAVQTRRLYHIAESFIQFVQTSSMFR